MSLEAAPNGSGAPAAFGAASEPPPPRAAFGAIRTLRLLLIGTIVVPLLLGAIGGYVSYRASYQRAEAALAEAVAVAEENTIKVLDTHVLVAERIEDLLSGLTDAQIEAEQPMLHARLSEQIKSLPEVAAAWVIDANGHELVSARVYPVNHALDHSDRDDFRALRNPKMKTFIWALRAKSLDEHLYRPYFTVARRWQASDGTFRGIIVVAMSGDYFASFYDSLLGSSTAYTADVFREDGTNLARYPKQSNIPATPQADERLTKAFADKSIMGTIVSGISLSGRGSVIAYRRVANYPVYVTVGRSRASILHQWLSDMTGYVAVGAPAAIALILLSLLALRRTQREQTALAQARDAISQRAAIEAQLQQAQKLEAVGLLTAGIAHDFNNMLTVITGNIALLQGAVATHDQKLQRFISAALRGCERASALTKRLLEFSRGQPHDPRALDVNDTINGVSELLRRSLSTDVAVDTRLGGNLWPVFVDPGQLENALLNLAVNARDAMAGRGQLTIEIANTHLDDSYAASHPGVAAGDYVAVVVSDTGCGMPPEVLEKAFDPFFTTKEAGKGTGLGLSQVYSFATRSGGYCRIDSQPGRGTSVWLYLPRYKEAPPDNGGDAERAAGKDGRGAAPLATAGTAWRAPGSAEGYKPDS